MTIRTEARFHDAAIALGLVIALGLAALLSWPALAGPFLFDDFPNLQHLAVLQGNTDWASLAHYASRFEGQPGRPLAMLSFVLNDAAWPSDPRPFKYTNLMLHVLVGTVLFGLARSIARTCTDPRLADRVALLTAAAWLLHPMQLSTSMLVVQRMTQLSAVFAAAGLWGYVALAQRARNVPLAAGAVAILGIGTLLSVLCKENGALAPLLALVLNATVLRTALARLPTPARRILQIAPVLPVAALGIALLVRWEALTWYGTRDFTLPERLATQARVLCDYLARIVAPRMRGGGIFHDDFQISRGLLAPLTTLPAVLAIAGAVPIAFAVRRRWPVAAFAILWFAGGHLLESTVFPLEIYFEHRNYLPMFGPIFVLAWAACHAIPRWRAATLALVMLWLAHAAFLTATQAKVWSGAATLATVWAIEHPDSPRAMQQYADHLVRQGDPHRAAAVLLATHERGIGGAAFPLQALLIACDTRAPDLAADAWAAFGASPAQRDGFDLLGVVTALRERVVRGTCPAQFDVDDWLGLTAGLLESAHHASGKNRAYLHVERAHVFRQRRDLGATMRELELAAAAYPTAELALLGAATLASAGLREEAVRWARRGLGWTPPGVRGLLSRDEAQLRRMIELLERDDPPAAGG